MKLFAFDFDKTITKSDTILPICRFLAEYYNSIFLFRIIQFNFILFRLTLINSKKFKEKIVYLLLKEKSLEDVEKIVSDFITTNFDELFNNDIIEIINREKNAGNRIIIVTSNLELFVNPVKKILSFDEVYGTKIKSSNSIIGEGIEGENCSGIRKAEVVNELKSKYQFENVISYGDSKSDFDMLRLADESYLAHYKYSSLLYNLRCKLKYFNGKLFTKGIKVSFTKFK